MGRLPEWLLFNFTDDSLGFLRALSGIVQENLQRKVWGMCTCKKPRPTALPAWLYSQPLHPVHLKASSTVKHYSLCYQAPEAAGWAQGPRGFGSRTGNSPPCWSGKPQAPYSGYSLFAATRSQKKSQEQTVWGQDKKWGPLAHSRHRGLHMLTRS